MKILDRYILKKFLTAFFFVVIIMVTIICIINLTEMNDKFIKHNLGYKEIGKYYLYYSPYIANLISPIMVFIATVFITSKMASHTEIVAILSSGVSFKRMMVPYIIGSSLLAILTFFLIGWVIPDSNKFRVAFDLQYLKGPYYFEGRNVHYKIGPDIYAYMETYSSSENKGYRFTLERIEGNKLTEKLKADYIVWNPEKGKWDVRYYETMRIEGLKEVYTQGTQIDTLLNLYPKDFGSKHLLHETMTLSELDNFIKEQKERGEQKLEVFQIQKYTIFTYPFAIIILTIIGLIVSSKKTRGGAGFQIALGFLIAFIYIIFTVMSRSIAQAGDMNPIVAVWMPNIIFAAVGAVLYHTVPR